MIILLLTKSFCLTTMLCLQMLDLAENEHSGLFVLGISDGEKSRQNTDIRSPKEFLQNSSDSQVTKKLKTTRKLWQAQCLLRYDFPEFRMEPNDQGYIPCSSLIVDRNST
jgi:hypothetical protein